MHFGHIFHRLEHDVVHGVEEWGIHEAEGIVEHAAIGVVASLI